MITWTTEKRKIDDLNPAPYNPRQATEKDKDDLNKSLEKFNVADPLIINTNNRIIGGHFRHRIMKERGIVEVDVRVPNRELTEDEEKELNLRLNKNLGQWDWDALANFDEEMLKDIGFTEEEMMENFGLNDAENIQVEQERMNVITVEAPESPKIFSRQSFYFDNKDDFDKVKEFFKTDREGRLDIQKIMDLVR